VHLTRSSASGDSWHKYGRGHATTTTAAISAATLVKGGKKDETISATL